MRYPRYLSGLCHQNTLHEYDLWSQYSRERFYILCAGTEPFLNSFPGSQSPFLQWISPYADQIRRLQLERNFEHFEDFLAVTRAMLTRELPTILVDLARISLVNGFSDVRERLQQRYPNHRVCEVRRPLNPSLRFPYNFTDFVRVFEVIPRQTEVEASSSKEQSPNKHVPRKQESGSQAKSLTILTCSNYVKSSKGPLTRWECCKCKVMHRVSSVTHKKHADRNKKYQCGACGHDLCNRCKEFRDYEGDIPGTTPEPSQKPKKN